MTSPRVRQRLRPTAAAILTAVTAALIVCGCGAAGGATSAQVDPCAASSLRAEQSGTNGATGHQVAYLALRNTGTRSCRLGGWPKLQFVTASGAVLDKRVSYVKRNLIGLGGNPAVITLRPGEAAHFVVAVAIESPVSGSVSCAHTRRLKISPPGTAGTLTLADRFIACGPATVTALQARG